MVVLYVVGYFASMDRQRPTSPFRAEDDYFESSFRWAGKRLAGRDTGPETPFANVTIWNVVYRPVDKVYVHFFPRPKTEVERLRKLGYYQ